MFLKCSSQKDYVILATRTPPKEEQNENLKHPKAKLDTLDEEWVTEHASQVKLSHHIDVCIQLINKRNKCFLGCSTGILQYSFLNAWQ